jgi:hypothetical protein
MKNVIFGTGHEDFMAASLRRTLLQQCRQEHFGA